MKQIISPSQAFLLLIEHYKKVDLDTDRLKHLFLNGPDNQQDFQEIALLFTNEIFKDYEINYDKKTINNDPSRRYFETHLAYHTTMETIASLDKDALESHEKNLEALNWMTLDDIADILDGKFRPTDDSSCKEYAIYFNKLKNQEFFDELSKENQEKVVSIIKASLLGVTSSIANALPLEIYGAPEGPYASENRGKEILEEQDDVHSANLGLMKSYMPVAETDIARSKSSPPATRAADQATYIEGASWVEDTFKRGVHPYSNSISGTMLAQLRNLSHIDTLVKKGTLNNDGEIYEPAYTQSPEEMTKFIRLFTTVMLYASGGHSLYEYTAPLLLKEVKEEFAHVEGFNDITLNSLFNTGNKAAFEKAIDESIAYNNRYLQQARIKAEIQEITEAPALSAFATPEFQIAKSNMISRVVMANELFEDKVKSQFFSSYRAGHQQNILFKKRLSEVNSYLVDNNLEKAHESILLLGEEFEQTFGKNNLWGVGKKNEAYQLIEYLKKGIEELNDMKAGITVEAPLSPTTYQK